MYNIQKEKKHFRKDICYRVAGAEIPIETVKLAKITGEKRKQSSRESKTANKPNNMVKTKVKRNNASYRCNTLAAERSSREGKPR